MTDDWLISAALSVIVDRSLDRGKLRKEMKDVSDLESRFFCGLRET